MQIIEYKDRRKEQLELECDYDILNKKIEEFLLLSIHINYLKTFKLFEINTTIFKFPTLKPELLAFVYVTSTAEKREKSKFKKTNCYYACDKGTYLVVLYFQVFHLQ